MVGVGLHAGVGGGVPFAQTGQGRVGATVGAKVGGTGAAVLLLSAGSEQVAHLGQTAGLVGEGVHGVGFGTGIFSSRRIPA